MKKKNIWNRIARVPDEPAAAEKRRIWNGDLKVLQPPPSAVGGSAAEHPRQTEGWTEEEITKTARWLFYYTHRGIPAAKWDKISMTLRYVKIEEAKQLLSSLRPVEHLICPTCRLKVCEHDCKEHKREQPARSEVFVLTYEIDYEGSTVEGVFASIEAAKAKAEASPCYNKHGWYENEGVVKEDIKREISHFEIRLYKLEATHQPRTAEKER